MPNALITGASRGLGLALADALVGRGWTLLLDARGPETLAREAERLAEHDRVEAISGDVSDQFHRRALARSVARLGGLDLLVNNASDLGPTPLPPLANLDPGALTRLLDVNVVAPLALFQSVAPHLTAMATVINITSDAAVEAYPGWGGYGASKAALEQLSAVLAVEHPHLRVYAFDPGDMRTQMHQDAFPGEDISDRPGPATVVPALVRLLERRPPSGRWRAAEVPESEGRA